MGGSVATVYFSKRMKKKKNEKKNLLVVVVVMCDGVMVVMVRWSPVREREMRRVEVRRKHVIIRTGLCALQRLINNAS